MEKKNLKYTLSFRVKPEEYEAVRNITVIEEKPISELLRDLLRSNIETKYPKIMS